MDTLTLKKILDTYKLEYVNDEIKKSEMIINEKISLDERKTMIEIAIDCINIMLFENKTNKEFVSKLKNNKKSFLIELKKINNCILNKTNFEENTQAICDHSEEIKKRVDLIKSIILNFNDLIVSPV